MIRQDLRLLRIRQLDLDAHLGMGLGGSGLGTWRTQFVVALLPLPLIRFAVLV
jgi:hypothetical protein